jgi:mitogen-activated protein kinase kinase
MLLKHPWLKPLVAAPSIIEEEEEDEEKAEEAVDTSTPDESKSSAPDDVVDREVAEWVIQALEKRRLGKLAKSEKPALHAAPLDAMVSPAAEKVFSHEGEAPAAEETKPADEESKAAVDGVVAPEESAPTPAE